MTTVLADGHLGVMHSDSCFNDGDRVWVGRKVWRAKGHLIGFAGSVSHFAGFLAWWKGGMRAPAPEFTGSYALILSPAGTLSTYTASDGLLPAGRREAIGTGGKAAMTAYEALGWTSGHRAVSIACRHDSSSRPPVRTYRLTNGTR